MRGACDPARPQPSAARSLYSVGCGTCNRRAHLDRRAYVRFMSRAFHPMSTDAFNAPVTRSSPSRYTAEATILAGMSAPSSRARGLAEGTDEVPQLAEHF